MQMQDKSKFTSLMAGMGELYGKVILGSQVDFYWDTLQNFEMKDIRQAFKSHIHNSIDGQYFPTLRELLQFIAGDHTSKVEQAWLIVEDAFHQIACYESFVLTDPITQSVLAEMGGWLKPRSALLKDMYFYAIEFKELYREFLENAQNKVEDSE